ICDLNFSKKSARDGVERVRGTGDSSGELASGEIGNAERGALADADGIGVGLRHAEIRAHAVSLGDSIEQSVAFIDEHAVVDISNRDDAVERRAHGEIALEIV